MKRRNAHEADARAALYFPAEAAAAVSCGAAAAAVVSDAAVAGTSGTGAGSACPVVIADAACWAASGMSSDTDTIPASASLTVFSPSFLISVIRSFTDDFIIWIISGASRRFSTASFVSSCSFTTLLTAAASLFFPLGITPGVNGTLRPKIYFSSRGLKSILTASQLVQYPIIAPITGAASNFHIIFIYSSPFHMRFKK